jgi:intracellular sulfur oxidation DsrE/DsrF family protein
MRTNQYQQTTHRRGFLGALTKGAAAFGLSGLLPFNQLQASETGSAEKFTYAPGDADQWFKQVKGKHKIVYDATQPHEIFPFAWPKVFLLTNAATGTPANDCGVVVVLRHTAIAYAFDDRVWSKYKFGELFGAPDPKTKAASLRNPFWQPKPGDFKLPGIGEVQIGINELQADGVMFCMCEMAMGVFTARAAEMMNMKQDDVKKDWMAGLLPGIQLVPSGVWAVGRAQEHGCGYCFAG